MAAVLTVAAPYALKGVVAFLVIVAWVAGRALASTANWARRRVLVADIGNERFTSGGRVGAGGLFVH